MRTALVLLFAVSAISLSACRDSNSAEQSTPTHHTEAAVNMIVPVTLNEYSFEVEQDTFIVGVPYTFRLENAGALAHEWAVVPHGDTTENAMLIEVEDDELPAGGHHEATFAFEEAGAYDFVCFMAEPISHDGAGMRIPITVVDPNE